MKKVVSNTGEVISFLVRGQRHSANAVEFDIDEKGVIMRDEDAAIVASRLGGQVTVSDIDVKTAKAEAESAIDDAEKIAKEAEKKAKAEAKAKAKAEAAKQDK
jgi:hypothetical protein